MLYLENLKASIVLQAMVTGLKKSKNDSNFVVKMESSGYVRNQLCYGNAATVTLAEMFGGGRSASEMMLSYVKAEEAAETDKLENLEDLANYARIGREVYLFNVVRSDPSSTQGSWPIELEYFENAIGYAQIGEVSSLIEFLTGAVNKSFDRRWGLEDDDWEEQIPKIETTIAEMINAGY